MKDIKRDDTGKVISVNFHPEKNRRFFASLSLLSIFMAVGVANHEIWNSGDLVDHKSESRSLASAPVSLVRNTEWERAIAQKLSERRERVLASVSQRPTQIEKLRFGALEGKYALRMADGKISEIEFSDAQSVGDHPNFINDRVAFLMQNRVAFAVEFSRVERISEERSKNSRAEVYGLFNADGAKVGQVRFQLDERGRFIAMKFHPEQKVAAN